MSATTHLRISIMNTPISHRVSDLANGSGILMPALKYRFYVRFLDADKQPLSYGDDLTRQVVSISPYNQTADVGEAESDALFIKMEEDVSMKAAKAMQLLLAEDDFTLRMETVDGNDRVVKTVDIEMAWLQKIIHSDVDYGATSGGRNHKLLSLKIPEPMGSTINAMREKSPEAEMIFQLIAGSEFSLHAEDFNYLGSTVSPILVIGYNAGSVKVNFEQA